MNNLQSLNLYLYIIRSQIFIFFFVKSLLSTRLYQWIFSFEWCTKIYFIQESTQDKYTIPLQSVGASRAAFQARCIENKGSLSHHLFLPMNSYKRKKKEAIT